MKQGEKYALKSYKADISLATNNKDLEREYVANLIINTESRKILNLPGVWWNLERLLHYKAPKLEFTLHGCEIDKICYNYAKNRIPDKSEMESWNLYSSILTTRRGNIYLLNVDVFKWLTHEHCPIYDFIWLDLFGTLNTEFKNLHLATDKVKQGGFLHITFQYGRDPGWKGVDREVAVSELMNQCGFVLMRKTTYQDTVPMMNLTYYKK